MLALARKPVRWLLSLRHGIVVQFALRSPAILSLAIFVLAPSLLAAVYFSLIASPQFETEARFAVRAARLSDPSSFIPTLTDDEQKTQLPISAATDTDLSRDAFLVSNYIRSRNIVLVLDADRGLRRVFGRPGIDYFSRFPQDATLEDLWTYWKGKARASVDSISGIVTLRVQAFSAAESLALANKVLLQAERMLNDYSARIRMDALAMAEQELSKAESEHRAALISLRDFRDSEAFIDPKADISATAKALLRVQLERSSLERERSFASGTLKADAPSLRIINSRLQALDEQIAALQSELTSNDAKLKAASRRIGAFEELELRQQFSGNMLKMVQAAYQRARLQMQKQELYLVLFSPPILPEVAQYPRTLVNTFLVFICTLIGWTLVRLIVAGVRDQSI